ncbi:hypothetical protein J7T55_010722 [Diaporthe amygdali]|uniref:uncharacterized protein n=1 Tax=Phomopsis amygdali TaxID=1214568 RepID=UPI0022FE4B92|nr:uncharacterized protein J7T55_010722 [Diaporthe amygdali]KAJ0114333.1 hypothetical protein J7T55_010722 [Diaporthe amygdali]
MDKLLPGLVSFNASTTAAEQIEEIGDVARHQCHAGEEAIKSRPMFSSSDWLRSRTNATTRIQPPSERHLAPITTLSELQLRHIRLRIGGELRGAGIEPALCREEPVFVQYDLGSAVILQMRCFSCTQHVGCNVAKVFTQLPETSQRSGLYRHSYGRKANRQPHQKRFDMYSLGRLIVEPITWQFLVDNHSENMVHCFGAGRSRQKR